MVIKSPSIKTNLYPKLPTCLTTVTPISKCIAVILFIVLPFVGFYLGISYQKRLTTSGNVNPAADGNSRVTPLPVTDTPAYIPPYVYNSTLYFLRNDTLYRLYPLNSEPTVYMDTVDTYSFSPDKKRIAYIKYYGPEIDNSVYVKNLVTNKLLTIKSDEWGDNRAVNWSPLGTLLLVDAGTGPEGSLTVYDYISGKKLSSFGDGKYEWQNERAIVMSQRTVVEPGRPWGGGEGYSLARVDVTTGISETLMKSDALHDYRVMKIDEACVYYVREQVQDPNDWGETSKTVSQYFCYDFKTKTSKAVSGTDSQPDAYLLRTKVENAFPEFGEINKNEILHIVAHPLYPNWIIMEIYHGESVFNSDIVIFNLDSPKETYRKIATGAQITWF